MWIPKIKLQVNEMTGVPEAPGVPAAEGEEPTEATEASGGSAPYEPIAAVVRVKIAKRIPEPVEDEEGNMVQPEYVEDELEEMPIDDKCLSVTTNTGEQSIFCIN